MRTFWLSAVLFFLVFVRVSVASPEDEYMRLYKQYSVLAGKGDHLNARLTVDSMLRLPLPQSNRMVALICKATNSCSLGGHAESLMLYSEAEKICDDSLYLGHIYIGKGIVYDIIDAYSTAVEHYEKAIRIVLGTGRMDSYTFKLLNNAYYNLAIAYRFHGNYPTAAKYFNLSLELHQKHKIEGICMTFAGLAKTFAGLGDNVKAEEYFRKSIGTAIREYGSDYYRLPELNFFYGEFLKNNDRPDLAIVEFRRSLKRYLQVYGEKHTLTSKASKYIADMQVKLGNHDSALYYYQKSMISAVPGFNDMNMTKNPSPDSSLHDIRLLDNLKGKAGVLEILSKKVEDPEQKLKMLRLSLETNFLAQDVIDRLRNSFAEDDVLYINSNEKETYLSSVRLLAQINSAQPHDSITESMYRIVQKAKASVLRRQIAGSNLFSSPAVPDSMKIIHDRIAQETAACNKAIGEENEKEFPDKEIINRWKDALFELNRQREELLATVYKVLPNYETLIRRMEVLSVDEIRSRLGHDEVILDYFISDKSEGGVRKMFVFMVSDRGITYRESDLDSLFSGYAALLRDIHAPDNDAVPHYDSYAAALHGMHRYLIEPFEDLFSEKRLIIIPDGETSWLSFDSFLRNKPESGMTDFEGLHFLIRDYTFSYSYSSSLLPGSEAARRTMNGVITFLPEYDGYPGEVSPLDGAKEEIRSIGRYFASTSFEGGEATKGNFLTATGKPAIFHLAMHSSSDSLNSIYSSLLFDPERSRTDSGKLFNFEISLSRIISPMVVLSACNSGKGTLYSGEGMISLARSFILAGASSVVRTAWEVNDDASSEIMKSFYKYLSKGMNKDEALRRAKLDFIDNSSPSFSNPYYWAAYEILGDNGPVTNKWMIVTIVTILIAGIVVSGILYLRRRRIF